MNEILVIKCAALGDVLRTTSILPGVIAKYHPCRVTWVTSPDARDLIVDHPSVSEVWTVEVDDPDAVMRLGRALAERGFDLVLSLDDDESLCRLALAACGGQLVGAYVDDAGKRVYTDDAEPWFGMGLLARDGLEVADRRKIENRRTHADIFADMLGIEKARPQLPLPDEVLQAAARRLAGRSPGRPLVGINTGAGGRWPSKALSVERTIQLIDWLVSKSGLELDFVLCGGMEERRRNQHILAGVATLGRSVYLIDPGTDNDLREFAALVSHCDAFVTSDSLGMHIAIARQVPPIAFFAPTSAAEIDLFGAGEKVVSTAPDYCSYRADVDNSTITPERLGEAVARVLRS